MHHMSQPDCALCARLERQRQDPEPALITTLEQTHLFVGDHQAFPGYCVLVLKEHVSALHELNLSLWNSVNQDLRLITQALMMSYQPLRVNYSCYGNVVPHLHWHLFPRHQGDFSWPNPPWSLMQDFDRHKTTPEMQADCVHRLRKALAELASLDLFE